MEKLELKKEEIIPYLLYDLKVMDLYDNKERFFVGYSINHTEPVKISVYKNLLSTGRLLSEVKPILRPLSDFNKVLYPETFKIFNLNWQNSENFCLTPISVNSVSYELANILIKNHFDVFGLIKKGLAIDKNILIEKAIEKQNEIDNFSDRFHPKNQQSILTQLKNNYEQRN